MKYFKKDHKKEPWQIAAARFCVAHSEEGFTEEDLIKHIESLCKVDKRHLYQFYEEEIRQPAGRKFSRGHVSADKGGVWVPPLDLVSKITDYDELQEARESSRKAMVIATRSLAVAIVVGILQILVDLATT